MLDVLTYHPRSCEAVRGSDTSINAGEYRHFATIDNWGVQDGVHSQPSPHAECQKTITEQTTNPCRVDACTICVSRTFSHSPDIKADDPPPSLAVALAHGLHTWRHVGLLLLVACDGDRADHWKNCARR